MSSLFSFLLAMSASLCYLLTSLAGCKAQSTCSLNEYERDSALREMTYDTGSGEQRIWVYIEPSMNQMYKGNPPASTKVTPKFQGFSTKFFNLGNLPVKLFWVPGDGRPGSPMNVILPFHEAGTASFPGHQFRMTDPDNESTVYKEFKVKAYPDNLQIFDPYFVEDDPEATEQNLSQLSPMEREKYDELRQTIDFSLQYLDFTGRYYLANYLRDPPRHFMWPAEYFGQEHFVATKETHFTEIPPKDKLKPITTRGLQRALKETDPRPLAEYRDPDKSIMNMTMTVLSVAPRVFEIQNFISPVEVAHILNLAAGIELSRSTVGNVEKDLLGGKSNTTGNRGEVKADTRTSRNAWLKREQSPIIDAIYRRAADLMRIDESLLRDRDEDEAPDIQSKSSLAEQLQLVHYSPGQEYTAHHDFGYRDLKKNQKARFSTLLLYLNHEGLQGGETAFPRWSNAETFDKLRVKPETGKAVLFYSQLPDGNFDDLSQHQAIAPRAGEKWLINLWTWDPVKDD